MKMIASYVKSIASAPSSSLSAEQGSAEVEPSGHPNYPERQERMLAVLKVLKAS